MEAQLATYISPDLNNFADAVTRTDLARAGALLRYSVTPSVVALGRGSLVTHIAFITASRGADAALLWLDGYWYVTGVREHALITSIQTILTAEVAS